MNLISELIKNTLLLVHTARFSIYCPPSSTWRSEVMVNHRIQFPAHDRRSLGCLPTWESKPKGSPLSSKQKSLNGGVKHERGFCAFFFIIIFLKIRITHRFFPPPLSNSWLRSSSSAVQAASVINDSIDRWVKNLFFEAWGFIARETTDTEGRRRMKHECCYVSCRGGTAKASRSVIYCQSLTGSP